MIYLICLLFVITASATVVKVGSVALRMTGLDKDAASFQALSAFSGSGFTTSESELVVKNPTRRRIVKALMILGNAGIISMIGTMMLALNEQALLELKLEWRTLPQLLGNPIVRMALFLLTLLLIYHLAVARWFNRWLDGVIERRLKRIPGLSEMLDFEALLTLGDHGMGAIDIQKGNPICHYALRELSLTQNDILVLAVVRGSKTINTPPADLVVQDGDRLVCYGDLEKMRGIASRDPGRSTRRLRRSPDRDPSQGSGDKEGAPAAASGEAADEAESSGDTEPPPPDNAAPAAP